MNCARMNAGRPSGRKPRFYPTDAMCMAILRDNGWTYDRIAASFGTVRSVVRDYIEARPSRWAT
jgi:hypothetical protein